MTKREEEIIRETLEQHKISMRFWIEQEANAKTKKAAKEANETSLRYASRCMTIETLMHKLGLEV